MAATRIIYRFDGLLDIAVTRAAPVWIRLNADGSVSERSASQTLGDIGAVASADLSGYVPTSRTIAGQPLTGNVSLAAADVGIGTFMDAEIVSGTSTDPGLPTPEQLKLAAETHGGGVIGTITQATTARTLALADIGNYIRCTHASGCAITIPQQTTVAWPDGSIIYIRRATGAGAITLAGAGITYNDSAVASVTAGQSFALRKAATDSWDFI